MKNPIVAIISLFILLISSCSDESAANQKCSSDEECKSGETCTDGKCTEKSVYPENDENSLVDSDDNGVVDALADEDISLKCNPGDSEKSVGMFPDNVGACKDGIKICSDAGFWDEWKAVWPEFEPCEINGVDEDCDGEIDNVNKDLDGDGYGACESGVTPDCCEIPSHCDGIDPNLVNPGAFEIVGNGVDDNCDGTIDEEVSACDTELDPLVATDHAKAIGLCTVYDEKKKNWGVISAEFHLADGTGAPAKTYDVTSRFGEKVTAVEGNMFAILSTGDVDAPLGYTNEPAKSESKVISEWIDKQSDQQFPVADACPAGIKTSGPNPTVFDPVMLELNVKVPGNANAFSFDSFFYTKEYSDFICTQYNDFFIALLNSEFNEKNPNLPEDQKNPSDMNLAMDVSGNPVGVNLAPAGLFTKCMNASDTKHNPPEWEVNSCKSIIELRGTGFEDNGATGWLVTRGNVVPGEIITLRLIIWDTYDNKYDSTILIDNFTWYGEAGNTGTGDR